MPNPAKLITKNRRKAVGRMLTHEQVERLLDVAAQADARQLDAADVMRLTLLTGKAAQKVSTKIELMMG